MQLRGELLTARQAARNQLQAWHAGAVLIARVAQRLAGVGACYDAQLASLAAAIAAQLPTTDDAQAQEWRPNLGLLLSSTGVGLWPALWVLVATVNCTSCTSVEQAVG